VLEVVFILLEPLSPSRRFFIGSHSLPPSLVRRIGPSLVYLKNSAKRVHSFKMWGSSMRPRSSVMNVQAQLEVEIRANGDL
jgi:hypothetical protein